MYMAVSDKEYLKKMQEIVYTEKVKEIFSLIYNYKVELEADKKIEELKKVKELEKYLKNNINGIQRYQYKLGYKEKEIERNEEKLPTLGTEESQMYCVCRDRMKKNRTSWSIEGAEALLKVIMYKMNETIEKVITKKAEEEKPKKSKAASASKEAGEKKPRKPRKKAVSAPAVCPICHKGTLLRGKTAYGCSEYKNGCTFRLDYATYGADLTDEQLAQIANDISNQ